MDNEVARLSTEGTTPEVFAAMAELVYATDDYPGIYQALVRAAPQLVDGCDHASLMLHQDGKLTTSAASDDIGARIDEYERELGEGPCLDAIMDESAYHDPDLTDGSPWPRLTERVLAETPVRGMAGFRLSIGGRTSGALNLFSDEPGALTRKSVDQGIILASFVTVALLAAHERQEADTLRRGLHSNREIGKAVGLMMAFHKIGDAEAFDMLRATSQEMNIKLVDVAKQIVEHHNSN